MDDGKGLLNLASDWKEILIAWFLAILGGLARYAQQFVRGIREEFGYGKTFAKLFLAGFSGLCFYWFTSDWNIAPHWKALCIALSGHMGAEGIEYLEARFFKRDDYGSPPPSS